MKKNKYNTLVQQIAQEMAERRPEEDLPWEHFIPYARIAVKHMAAEYRAGYMSNCPDNDDDTEDIWKENCHYEMVDRGLIPTPEQEAGTS